MIRLLGSVPKTVYLACSGGIDSMVALDFLRRKHNVIVAFYDHGTDTSKEAFNFLKKHCANHALPFVSARMISSKPSNHSLEEHWRNSRYDFLDRLDYPVVTAHHLDDCVETWIWSSLHGQSKLPLYRRGNVFRPFLLNQKKRLIEWAETNDIPYIEDASNDDTRFTRNYIRKEMMEHVLRVNPGIHKMIKKKLTETYKGKGF